MINQPFVHGLASISLKFGNYGDNVAQRTGLKNEPVLYGEPAPGVRIHTIIIGLLRIDAYSYICSSEVP